MKLYKLKEARVLLPHSASAAGTRRMTIHSAPAAPGRECSQLGHRRSGLRWDLSPLEIRAATEGLINRVKRVYDDVGALKIENVSVENTLKALANAKLDYACEWCKSLGFSALL